MWAVTPSEIAVLVLWGALFTALADASMISLRNRLWLFTFYVTCGYVVMVCEHAMQAIRDGAVH